MQIYKRLLLHAAQFNSQSSGACHDALEPRMIEAGVRAGMADYDYRYLAENLHSQTVATALPSPAAAYPQALHCIWPPPMGIWRHVSSCCVKGRS